MRNGRKSKFNTNSVEKVISCNFVILVAPLACFFFSLRCPLFMDCTDEGLSEAQKRATADKTAKFTEQMKKLEAMAKAGARIIQHDNGSVTFRLGLPVTDAGP